MPRTRPDTTVPDLSGRRTVVTAASDGASLALARRPGRAALLTERPRAPR